MSPPLTGSETYPSHEYSNALEQEASEVLRLVQSVQNTFAPINRIPPEILLLIPGYYKVGGDDEYYGGIMDIEKGEE